MPEASTSATWELLVRHCGEKSGIGAPEVEIPRAWSRSVRPLRTNVSGALRSMDDTVSGAGCANAITRADAQTLERRGKPFGPFRHF